MLKPDLMSAKWKKTRAMLMANVSVLALSACGGSSGEDDLDTGEIAAGLNIVDGATDELDSIPGTVNSDYIEALGGDDFVLALTGDDEIYGGDGNDTLFAHEGDDTIYGGDGDDTIYPGEGDDKSYGGAGNDIIYLSSGNDIEDGGEGNDTLKIPSTHSGVATTVDLLIGQYYFTVQGSSAYLNLKSIENVDSQASANLTILDTPGINVISTSSGNDTIKSVGGNDTISTGGGNDSVELATGFEYEVKLGSGDDTVQLGLTYSTIDGGSGTDTVKVKEQDGISDFYADLDTGFYYFKGVEASQDGFDTLLKDFEAVIIEGSVNSELIGGDQAETFTGGDGIDKITGGAGNDVIVAGAEADTISGGSGADTLTGGAGADIFTGFSIEDQSVVASANTFANPIAATNTITFATGSAGSIDVITDFVSGTDKLDVTKADTAPVNLIGISSAGALVDGTGFILYGTYVATTGVFTAAAGYNATTANDALFVEGDGTETAITESDYVLLLDLNQALVSTDFI